MMRRRWGVSGWSFIHGMGVPLLLGVTARLATRGWVQKRMGPLAERVSDVEGRLGQSEAKLQLVTGKADGAPERLDNLGLC